jgi:hypothetical protein
MDHRVNVEVKELLEPLVQVERKGLKVAEGKLAKAENEGQLAPLD